MEQLTHEIMPRFMEQLHTLVDGHRFTLHCVPGLIHKDMHMKELNLKDRPEGLKILSLDMGKVTQLFTSYFSDSSSEPIVKGPQTHRVMYEFTPRSLEVHLTFLSPNSPWVERTVRIMTED